MARIFISYRRDDTAGHAGRLHDALVEHFSPDQVFMDISDLEPGVDFAEAIEAAVGSADVAVIMIGRHWLDAVDRKGHRRLDDPNDFVRLEAAEALGRPIRVIPVLVQGAMMPDEEDLPAPLASLVRRQAHDLSDARWQYDVDRLAATIRRALDGHGVPATPRAGSPAEPPVEPRPATAAQSPAARARGLVPGALGVAVIATLALAYWLSQAATGAPPTPAPAQPPAAQAGPPTTAPAAPKADPKPTSPPPTSPPAQPPAANRGWILVLGTVGSAAEAQAEVGKATRAGLQAGKVYLWRRSAREPQWYVPTVGPYASEAAARPVLATASRAVGREVSVADLSAWCGKSVARSGYDECVE